MLDRIAELLIFGFTPLVIGMLVAPGAPQAAEHVLHGEVLYRERIALPPNAIVSVQLADVSLADAPAAILGEQKIDPAGQVPVKFEIRFDPSVVQPNMSYALQARIATGDTLWFVNDERYTIDPKNPGAPVEMKVVMVRKNTDEPVAAGIEGRDWLAENIQGSGVIDNAQTTLTVTSDGAVSGSGGCNRYFSRATVSGENVSFADIGSTYMQCPAALMNQERKFLDADGKEMARLSQNL